MPTHTKRLARYAKLITDYNIFVTNESSKSIKIFPKGSQILDQCTAHVKNKNFKKTKGLNVWHDGYCI
jgi:hypothetical protein